MALQIGLVADKNGAARQQHLAVAQIVQDLFGRLERAPVDHRVDDHEMIDVVRGAERLRLAKEHGIRKVHHWEV